jgi:hypothetical protein
MNDDHLVNTYNEFMILTDKLLGEDVKAIEIAPILIKLGLEIYKTVMSPDDYDRMVDFISDHRDEINDLSDFLPELH